MKKEDFDSLLQGVREAGAIMRGELKPAAERVVRVSAKGRKSRGKEKEGRRVQTIRKGLHLTQGQFARLIGVPRATLQNWEQGRRQPQGPAAALLTVAEKCPQAVLEALHAE